MYSKDITTQKKKHIELINTIKKENIELKEQVNQIFLMLQQTVLTNTLHKKNSSHMMKLKLMKE